MAVSDDVVHVFHLYVVRLLDGDSELRDSVRERLAAAGIESGIHYARPLHLQPAYAHLGYRRGEFPTAERLAHEILSLPMFPEISPEQQEHVLATLAGALD
jgi:dTDP-4-amino-4,6-dideoxygalactose transaminase